MSTVKHILGAGCSFTKNGWFYPPGSKQQRESDHIQQEPNDYPRIIAENLGITADNIAIPGSGWQFQMYLVQKWVENNRDKVKDTLLVMGITSIERGTFFTEAKDPGKFIKYNIKRVPNHLTPNVQIPNHEKDYNYWRSRGYDPQEVADFFRLYYTIAYDSDSWSQWQYMQLRMFQSWLRDIGLRFLFIDALDKEKRPEEIENLYIFPDGSQVWTDYIKSYDKNYNLILHPNIYDHIRLAGLLTDHIYNEYINI